MCHGVCDARASRAHSLVVLLAGILVLGVAVGEVGRDGSSRSGSASEETGTERLGLLSEPLVRHLAVAVVCLLSKALARAIIGCLQQ